MTRSRARRLAPLLVVVLLLAGACSKKEGNGKDVRAFIDETGTEPHRFVYTETTPSGVETVVRASSRTTSARVHASPSTVTPCSSRW